ncbi:hypothetical protein A2U01_0055346, partial [Trifolium medium]|nr:hypothetical protein [Trifolium medium]
MKEEGGRRKDGFMHYPDQMQ